MNAVFVKFSELATGFVDSLNSLLKLLVGILPMLAPHYYLAGMEEAEEEKEVDREISKFFIFLNLFFI